MVFCGKTCLVLRVIRAFVNEKFEEKRFSKVNQAYASSSRSLFRLMATAQPGFLLIQYRDGTDHLVREVFKSKMGNCKSVT